MTNDANTDYVEGAAGAGDFAFNTFEYAVQAQEDGAVIIFTCNDATQIFGNKGDAITIVATFSSGLVTETAALA